MIELIRGDSLSLKFQRLDAEGNVITTQADKVFFTIKKEYRCRRLYIAKNNRRYDFR